MGACCSKDNKFVEGLMGKEEEKYDEEEEEEEGEEGSICVGDCGERMILQGSSKFACMFTQKGRKGINQDAMTIWEVSNEYLVCMSLLLARSSLINQQDCDFQPARSSLEKLEDCDSHLGIKMSTELESEFHNFFIFSSRNGDEDTIFCGVFDGHGPSGHKVANHVRDVLPLKLSLELRSSNDVDDDSTGDDSDAFEDGHEKSESDYASFSSWKASFIKIFKEIDEELSVDSTIDTFCSGTTAVVILKQGEHLVIANLGDSRAILGTRDRKKQLVPVQLTVDLKPNLPSEAERIKNCKGRVFAMEGEPDVYRMWMPDENCPGLAMARAFGDFCLKDFGLISVPQVFYRKLITEDEFIVLATDGVWDVLSNKEVVQIVASARKQSLAARLLVCHAVQAWKNKYPSSKIDDCAVICLFPKLPSKLTKTNSDVKEGSANKFSHCDSSKTIRSVGSHESIKSTIEDSKEEWSALDGVSRANTVMKIPRFATLDNSQERLMNNEVHC